MKVVVVIPTFNEAANVERLVRVLEEEFKLLVDHQTAVLFVDDSSPDGTAEIIKKLQGEFGNIHLLLRQSKEGLGAAYIAGMKYAMEKLAAEVIVEMDADFQHDPADLKRFLVQIENGADYVIGSRFTKGGSIPKDWQIYRRLLSVLGNLTSRLILNLPNITDYTTGYKASRVAGFLKTIDLDNLSSRGFAYKMHLLTEMIDRGAKVKEIPIAFANREKGISKMEGNNPLDSLKVVLGIRIRKSQRFLKFLGVGFIGLILDFLGYAFLVRVGNFLPTLASVVSAQPSVISNYILNNLWTFSDRRHVETKSYLKGLILFALTSNIGVFLVRGSIVFFSSLVFGQKSLVNYLIGTTFLVIYILIVYNRVRWPRVNKVNKE